MFLNKDEWLSAMATESVHVSPKCMRPEATLENPTSGISGLCSVGRNVPPVIINP
jgi:hypothetical protein